MLNEGPNPSLVPLSRLKGTVVTSIRDELKKGRAARKEKLGVDGFLAECLRRAYGDKRRWRQR